MFDWVNVQFKITSTNWAIKTIISTTKRAVINSALFLSNYLLLMASIGFFLLIRVVGIKLARKALPQLMAKIRRTCLIPGRNNVICILSPLAIEELIIKQIIIVAKLEIPKFISAIIVASLKKIPKTSLPLAPSALKTPISRFL